MDKIQEETARLNVREILLEKLKEFTLLSDVFLTVALRDRAACQHVLRLLTGKEDLTVKEVRTQYRISKILSHDAILDVLAEDEEKRLYNLEIQRRDTVDHCRRTRFYGAMIDSEYLEKGKEYQELADVYIFYISETDIRKAGRTVYPVRKYSESDDADYDDGCDDDFVWIPYSRAVKLSRNADITSYTFTSWDTDDTDSCTETLEDFLYEHLMDEDLYDVTAMSSLLDSLNEQIGMMSMMLGGIAGISLLVAGVGVMNIMLVSVTERTREIGIRKALGAKRRVILQQFIIEAAVTSTIGGIIGIILGALCSTGIGSLIGIEAPPTMSAVLVSFSVSVGIGLIFGYMPASRASRLNPIDALRSE